MVALFPDLIASVSGPGLALTSLPAPESDEVICT